MNPHFKSSSFRSITLSGCALLLLAGCATRPPRTVGPPQSPVMPPPPQGGGSDLPAPVELDFEPVTTAPLPAAPSVRPAPMSRPKPSPRPGTPYTIKKGESLSAVASRNNMSWVKLAEYNHIANPDKIQVGQTILIPPSSGVGSAPSARRPSPPPPAANGRNTYVVQSGDNLTTVARRYSTTVNALKSLNNLRSDRLLVGQILKVPGGTSSAPVAAPAPATPVTRPAPEPTPAPVVSEPEPELELTPAAVPSEPIAEEDPLVEKPFTIVVMEGDTLESIAANYVVSVEKIRSLNNLPADAVLTPGQKLEMPPGLY